MLQSKTTWNIFIKKNEIRNHSDKNLNHACKMNFITRSSNKQENLFQKQMNMAKTSSSDYNSMTQIANLEKLFQIHLLGSL